MERPTTELILPVSKAKVVLFTYLTNGEYKNLQRELFKSIQIDPNVPMEEQKVEKLSATLALDQTEFATKYLVKEIFNEDGTKVENVDDFIFNLRIEDGNVLSDKVRELDDSSRLSEKAKKK